METILSEILIIFALILLNGFLAMSEIAVVSARKTKLEEWVENGDASAKVALEISNSPTDFLSTVQIGITLVGICAGAYGGGTIAEQLEVYVEKIPFLAPHKEIIGIALVVPAITYFSLILGELAPKQIALHSPEKIATTVAPFMRKVAHLARPLVLLLSASTSFVLKALPTRKTDEPSISEAEIQVLLQQAAKEGVVDQSEQSMISSILHLGDRKVEAVMTPATDVLWFDVNESHKHVLDTALRVPHEYFPVSKGSLDQVVGIVESKALLRLAAKGEEIILSKLLVEPLYVPDNITALQVLERFKGAKQEFALILDEYGALMGLVTRHDLFRAIVGEMPKHGVHPKWEATKREDGSFLLDGQLPTDEFKRMFNLEKLPSDGEESYYTLAGLILFYLKQIPKPGDTFVWESLSFEIVDLDGYRIDKVIVRKVNQGDTKTKNSGASS